MATKKITGAGKINSTDYHTVTWTGKTKSGKPVVITVENAINRDNIDWTMQDKDEIIAQTTFQATYEENNRDGSNGEPWNVQYDDTGASGIILGYGVVAIDGVEVALCRGGGKFTVEREFRDIEADGDFGPVKDRISFDRSVASLQINALTIIGNTSKLLTGVTETTATAQQQQQPNNSNSPTTVTAKQQ